MTSPPTHGPEKTSFGHDLAPNYTRPRVLAWNASLRIEKIRRRFWIG